MARDVVSMAAGGGIGGFIGSLFIGIHQSPPEVALLVAVFVAVAAGVLLAIIAVTENEIRGDA